MQRLMDWSAEQKARDLSLKAQAELKKRGLAE